MKFLFLDTMTLLHYKSIDEIDWLSLVNGENVKLVVSQAVIRELNRHKDSEGRKKLRERAAAALKRLKLSLRQSRAAPIRTGVELIFRETDPLIDFTAHKLTEKLADDWLIATMLEFQLEFPGTQAALVSADIGLQLKAVGHGFFCIELPEEYALPDEPDKAQVRVQALEHELEMHRKNIPHLKLTFEGGSERVEFRLNKLVFKTDQEIRRKLEDVRVRHPKAQKAEGYSGAALMLGAVGPADIDRYNQQLDRFYDRYEKYLRATDVAEDTQRRVIQLDISLLNDGFSPAKDTDIYLHFPDGLQVTEDLDEIIVLPEEPPAPEGPTSAIQAQLESISMARLGANPLMLGANLDLMNAIGKGPVFKNVSGPTIRRTNSFEVHFHVGELKHNLQAEFVSLFAVFDSWNDVRSFTLNYRLLAANLPRPVESELHVIVEMM